MEFQNNNGTATKDAAAKEINNAATNGAAKTNGTPAKSTNGNGKADAKETKPLPAGQAGASEAEKPAPAAPKAEEPKKDEPKPEEKQLVEEAKPAKPELTLDAKIKAVNDLHRKTIQRLALIARLKTLEEFEVKLIEENDELESNPYQGCKLIIEDDKRRQFTTNTPGLIRMVAQFIFDACETKLAEIEATINFPQA
jgi:hypothetical protein